MKRVRTNPKVVGLILLLALLMVLPAVSLAQEEEVSCNQAAIRLTKLMEIKCQDLLDLQAKGYGLGEIMKAWYLAQDLEGFGEWQDLLERKQTENLGWGQLKMASRLAGEDGDAEALLELKQSGVGWGHIKKAQAMEASGLMSFDEALAAFEADAGWDEIRDQLGLEEGPPPWAGPKDKDKGDNGPPAWANNDKKQDE